MRRGVRRGCIRLQGAVLGIDDEDDANFTITVDAKVFHLQAKDAEEREVWVKLQLMTYLRLVELSLLEEVHTLLNMESVIELFPPPLSSVYDTA